MVSKSEVRNLMLRCLHCGICKDRPELDEWSGPLIETCMRRLGGVD